MKARKIILDAFIATTSMTLFSVMLSLATGENFSEPHYLSKILHVNIPSQNENAALFEGWAIHYLVGLIFVSIYYCIWLYSKFKATILSGAFLGFASGIIAVFVWNGVLNFYPVLPTAIKTHYFAQLIAAHIVFGVCASACCKLQNHKSPH